MLTHRRERLDRTFDNAPIQDVQQPTTLLGDGTGRNTMALKQELKERRMTAPDGQVLPDWMTYVTYVTTIDGVSITTGSVADLPLTYYGPSIPLVPGWIYGGSTRSTSGISMPTSLSESISGEQTIQTTNVVSSSTPDSRASSFRTHSQSSSGSTISSVSLIPPTSFIPTSSSTPNIHHNILAPLLAALIPVGIALLVFLFLLCIYNRKRSDPDKGFLSWLFKPKLWASLPATPRFVAQHHRKSSSVSTGVENDAEIRELVQQNQSLFQRLSIGLGWASQTSNSSGGSGTSRRTSGNTLEKGLGAGKAVALAAAGAVGIGRGKDGTTIGTKSSGNGQKYERVLDDDQLFYKVPLQTHSSHGSRDEVPFSNSLSRPSTVESKRVNTQCLVREEVATPQHEGRPSMTFSVSVPETPGSRHLSERDMDVVEFGCRTALRPHISKERMRFPIPPGVGLYKDGGTSTNEDREGIPPTDSRATSSGSFYSANSALYRDTTPPPGSPLHRDACEYKHASVSAFGSHPATPTMASHDLGTTSSQSHRSPFSTNSHRIPVTRVFSASHDPSPFKLAASPSPRTMSNNVTDSSAILFAMTAQENAGSRATGVEGEGEEDHPDQPIIDETSLRREMVSRSRVGEFGEPLKPTYVFQNISPTQTSLAPSYSSEAASIHNSRFDSSSSHSPSLQSHQSHQSQEPSQSGSSFSSHRLYASINAASRDQALRGRRSHAQLVKTSRIVEQLEKVTSPSRVQLAGLEAEEQRREDEEEGDIGESSSLTASGSGSQS
ncbi:hypothetical protein CNBC0130 [Cryptococcus deneoformans B-3501A]|uniref:hypothetical protein n=1 Tax=Cryptococcus deneoformans (strain B-3501A) TaxID=283643 RepID=UPI000042EBEA|nr:hypothetical protein CNBC0130 [Cryptococcus neoformans var. neoformans B-3501A]EAL21872.1 hypothetical protein CNBC0130 [Cryptococcus neoformans var. neoformans B-3501A]